MNSRVKSFVLRGGKISKRQSKGLQHHLSQYALPQRAQFWSLADEFGREAETVVEIGFGMGSSLLNSALARPEQNFIGIEVHKAGIGSLAAELFDRGMSNVRIAGWDAVDVFQHYLTNDAVAGVQIFFPDPWPKKRHHKRRLMQADFVSLLVKKIKVGGFIHCATDWQDYADQMLKVLSEEPKLSNQYAEGFVPPLLNSRPMTKFEQRGQRLGHGIWDLIFIRNC